MPVCTASYFRRLEPSPPPLWEDHILQDFTSWYSNWATGWTVEEPGFDYQQAQRLVLFFTVSRPDVGPTLPRIKWSPGVKRPGQETDHSPSFSVKVKNKWIHTSTPHIFMSRCLIQIRNTLLSVSATFFVKNGAGVTQCIDCQYYCLCGLWRHVGWSTGINVFEELTPSIFLEEGQEL